MDTHIAKATTEPGLERVALILCEGGAGPAPVAPRCSPRYPGAASITANNDAKQQTSHKPVPRADQGPLIGTTLSDKENQGEGAKPPD